MGESFADRAGEIFSGVGMMRHLGVRLTGVGEDWAEMAFDVDERHGNYVGALHGGAVAAVMDTVGFFPGKLLPSGRRLTTEGLQLHFFRPVPSGERVTVRATILRLGRRVVTVETKATDNAGRAVAHGILTLLDMTP